MSSPTFQVLALTTCHCSICRKLSGSAFGTYAHVGKNAFRWISGEDLITRYESAPGSVRGFCRVCGSLAPPMAIPNPQLARTEARTSPTNHPSPHM